MKVRTKIAGKYTKVKCERCGENYYNRSFYIHSIQEYEYKDGVRISKPNDWLAMRGRYLYSNTKYLCYDCFVEVFKNLAQSALEQIKEFKDDKIRNVNVLKELAEFKHERKVFTLAEKAKKTKEKQTKTQERNVGLNVVGATL